MLKKKLLVLVLVAFIAGGAFAQSDSIFSVGFGFMGDGGANILMLYEDHFLEADILIGNVGFGLWGFVDARFAELSIALLGGPLFIDIWDDWGSDSLDGLFLALDISLLGKFPFNLGRVTLFPLLGVGYNAVLTTFFDYDDIGDFSSSDFNTFRIQAGFGLDINFSQSLFLRTSFLGAYRFTNRFIRDIRAHQEAIPGVSTSTFGLGGTVKIGLGLRL